MIVISVCWIVAATAVVLPAPVYQGPFTYGGALLPSVAKVAKVGVEDSFDPNPHYSFSYDVNVRKTLP